MKKFLALPLVPVLLACRPVGVDYARPKPPVPEHFAVQGGEAAPSLQWWAALGDPTLTELIHRAYSSSPDLRLAEAHLRQARAQQGVQDAQGGPTVALDGRVSRDHLSKNGETFANVPLPNPKVDFTNFQAGFDASWELDFFGHQRRISEAAQARTESSAERLQDARLQLAAEVARNYINLRCGQQRLILAEASSREMAELVRLARISFQAGDTSRQDLQQAELNQSSYLATLTDLQVGVRESQANLATLSGQSLEQIQAQVGAPGALMAVPAAPATGLPSDLLNRRPDLRSAERDLKAANADVGVAVAARYPRFSLVGTGGWNSIQSGTLLQNASRSWSLGPQFSLPLFNQGLLKNQVRVNQAAYDAALATYHKAVLSALGDVDVAFTRMSQNEGKRQQLLGAEAQQREMLALTERQFKAGNIAKVTLLQAQRALLSQQDQTLQAQSQSLTALVSICKALGGGWSGETR